MIKLGWHKNTGSQPPHRDNSDEYTSGRNFMWSIPSAGQNLCWRWIMMMGQMRNLLRSGNLIRRSIRCLSISIEWISIWSSLMHFSNSSEFAHFSLFSTFHQSLSKFSRTVTHLSFLDGKLDGCFGVQIRFGCSNFVQFVDQCGHLLLRLLYKWFIFAPMQ